MWVEVLDVVEVLVVRSVLSNFVVVVGVEVNPGVEPLVVEVNWHCSEILIKMFA